jgi:hypothetical protein
MNKSRFRRISVNKNPQVDIVPKNVKKKLVNTDNYISEKRESNTRQTIQSFLLYLS